MTTEPELQSNDRMAWKVSGVDQITESSFYRGKTARFWPIDKSLKDQDFSAKFLCDAPPRKLVNKNTKIVAFGSCFAQHISFYLELLGYDVTTKRNTAAYLARMGDGIVNTYAIKQQFEWAWLNKVPTAQLWHDYDNNALGYDEPARLATKSLLDKADVFIITLGLSEVWYDEPTGEVFWRAVPRNNFDPARHKFRNVTHEENRINLGAVHQLIRKFRPNATIIFSLSPIPLTATFRPLPCMIANTISKAVLRSSLDELMNSVDDDNLFYFPSYEIVLNCFHHQFMEDRRHVHHHVLNFAMKVFEKNFCDSGLNDDDIFVALQYALGKDRKVGERGHWAVKRTSLKWSRP